MWIVDGSSLNSFDGVVQNVNSVYNAIICLFVKKEQEEIDCKIEPTVVDYSNYGNGDGANHEIKF